jgi:hypothetical protein
MSSPTISDRAALAAIVAGADAEFDHVTSFFVPPVPSEAFNVTR